VDDGRTAGHYTTTFEVVLVRVQDAPRRHDWSKIARTVVNSMALLAMPPHVLE
jgi:hypothetical protein